jgi:hypothetical protein
MLSLARPGLVLPFDERSIRGSAEVIWHPLFGTVRFCFVVPYSK